MKLKIYNVLKELQFSYNYPSFGSTLIFLYFFKNVLPRSDHATQVPPDQDQVQRDFDLSEISNNAALYWIFTLTEIQISWGVFKIPIPGPHSGS